MGNDAPRNYQGRCIIQTTGSSCAAPFGQTVRGDMAIVDICMLAFGSIVLFSTACPRVVALTAPQTAGRRVYLCAHYYRAFRSVPAALQTAAAVHSQ